MNLFVNFFVISDMSSPSVFLSKTMWTINTSSRPRAFEVTSGGVAAVLAKNLHSDKHFSAFRIASFRDVARVLISLAEIYLHTWPSHLSLWHEA